MTAEQQKRLVKFLGALDWESASLEVYWGSCELGAEADIHIVETEKGLVYFIVTKSTK